MTEIESSEANIAGKEERRKEREWECYISQVSMKILHRQHSQINTAYMHKWIEQR